MNTCPQIHVNNKTYAGYHDRFKCGVGKTLTDPITTLS
ncbi:hypothetical protein ATHSA_p10009 (plasmid) [Athalassotoga saccharophila]|uniref:Uncharacterized protein n=1 Tax=Athalassotoga saccharophila TaxID=1441386 RepID=A0A6N4TCV4_9BACT|nr:hypothetical protein ATHSA_p10009 [Athalassotoga saccharophila]